MSLRQWSEVQEVLWKELKQRLGVALGIVHRMVRVTRAPELFPLCGLQQNQLLRRRLAQVADAQTE